MPGGLTKDGAEALHIMLSRYVEDGFVPGLVALVAQGDDVHVEAIGHLAFGNPAPMGRDAVSRIASITKPIAGVAAMALVEQGRMALDDPVARWLPELAEARVLRSLESDLDDTLALARPITVEDVLSFHMGFGSIMSPGSSPIQDAEQRLGLKTLGPPWPPVDLTPDEWLARFATLPLLEQPGTSWRYSTAATVAGVLIERVAGAPLAQVLEHLVFGPLGMVDTGFVVPPEKLDRLTTFYRLDRETGELVVFDEPPGWWSAPPTLPDAASALVSTVDDLWRFAAMLASAGGNVLTPGSVAEMTRNRMTTQERAANRLFVGDHSGWGLMMLVPVGDGSTGVPGGFGWDGGSGTTWRTDPATGRTGILLTQRMVTSPLPRQLVTDFWAAVYGPAYR